MLKQETPPRTLNEFNPAKTIRGEMPSNLVEKNITGAVFSTRTSEIKKRMEGYWITCWLIKIVGKFNSDRH